MKKLKKRRKRSSAKNKNPALSSNTQLVHKKKVDVCLDVRSKAVGETYKIAKQLEKEGLEIDTVLGKTGVIIGKVDEITLISLHAHPIVKTIEID